jgi:hypothetical protein
MNILKKTLERLRGKFLSPVMSELMYTRPDAASQLALRMNYQDRLRRSEPLPTIRQSGFQSYSQTDEDGILWFIFSILGEKNRICAEICCGDGVECNSANLIINHGWHALLVDGDARKMQRAEEFYSLHPVTRVFPPRLHNGWITRANVNEIMRQNDISGEVDLLSIDMDGMDYWVWSAIDAVQPRVVVAEYNNIWGAETSCTIPYSDDFYTGNYPLPDGVPTYCGASLRALVKLGCDKGYRLIGCNRMCFNAFFVRSDIPCEAAFPTIEPAACFDHPWAVMSMKKRLPLVQNLPWVSV